MVPLIITLTDAICFLIGLLFSEQFLLLQAFSLTFAALIGLIYQIYIDPAYLRSNYKKIGFYIAVGGTILGLRGGIMSFFLQVIPVHPIIAFIPCAALLTFVTHVNIKLSSKNFCLVLGILLYLVRFLYLGKIELLPEEGYYWNYAIHPAWGYIDHPPMVGWLIRIGTSIFGTTEFGVRIAGFVLSSLSLLAILSLHSKFFGKKGLYETFIILLLMPYLIGAGQFISPDSGLSFFWSISLYLLYKAIIEDHKTSWYLLGISLGLGMDSKYTIALLAIPTIIYCITISEYRKYFTRKEPYIAALIAIILFSPIILWNIKTNFASFKFQTANRAVAAFHFGLPSLIVDMSILVLPSTFLAIITVFLIAKIRKTIISEFDNNFKFSVIYFLGTASIFILYSLWHQTKLNWTGPSFFVLLPWAGYYLNQLWSEEPNQLSRFSSLILSFFTTTSLAFVFLISVTLHYIAFGLPFLPYGESVHRIIGWQSLSKSVLQVAETLSVQDASLVVIAGMDKHFITSNISFYIAKNLDQHSSNFEFASRNIIGENALMWDIWSNPNNLKGKTFLLVARNDDDLSDKRLNKYFSNLESITKLSLTTNQKTSPTYYIRTARGYQGISSDLSDEKLIPKSSPTPVIENTTPTQEPNFTPAPPAMLRS